MEYNLACSQALAGDRAAALDTLGQAVEDGYLDRKDTEADSDLQSLHTDPRWQPLLERMSVFSAEQDVRWGDAAFAAPNTPDLADADKLVGLSELWAQARYGFANFWHVPRLDWNRTYREYIPQVLATRSTAEYYRVLQRFYAQLEDGHSSVYPPELVNGKLSRLPLRTRLVEGHLLVVGSREPDAGLQRLKPGDEILTINGEAATAWAEQNIAPFVSASTRQDRDTRTYEYLPFLAPLGTTFTLAAETPSGKKTIRAEQVDPLGRELPRLGQG